MANISKTKRDRMLAFLEELKTQHNDDESIRAFNEIENHIRDKKYGLVWEEHTEQVDEMLEENIPVFCEDISKKIISNKSMNNNFILEGDNLQSLYLLEKTHKGKVDVVYIDPPYNNGKRNWKYNNDFIDKNDTFRHSKWLSMMHARMVIAKRLLKDNGAFVCAIDENELGTILLLINDVFGENYAIDCIAIIHNPRGIQGDNFSYIHEYAIFVYRKGYKVIGTREVSEEEIDWSPLRNWGDESKRHDAANCFYPIYVKNGQIIGFGDDITNNDDIHPSKNEYDTKTDIYAIYPIDVNGVERKWRYARQTIESIKDLLRVKEKQGVFDIEIGKDFAPYRTVWTDKKFDANEYGTQLINSMIPENDFDFPKSLYNVYECLYALTKNKPNAVILDYFAGSGTTGHATLLLNKQLGGNRKFIMCTNNDIGENKENEYKQKYGEIDTSSNIWKAWTEKYGIASSVTQPRIAAVIKGFIHKKDFKTILYSKKLTYAALCKSEKLLSEINNIKETEKNNHSEIKVIVEDDTIKVLNVVKKNQKIEGIPANLKYFKCGWTPRKPENYLLSNMLCLHIKEMIELQNGYEIDGVKNVLILTKDDFNKTILDASIYEQIENVWLNQNMILTAEEMKLLKAKGFKYIPKEFFGRELRESAE